MASEFPLTTHKVPIYVFNKLTNTTELHSSLGGFAESIGMYASTIRSWFKKSGKESVEFREFKVSYIPTLIDPS